MNDDDFEMKLRALTGNLHRPDPTPDWKADILACARRAADEIPIKRMLPPRWLMVSWATAWAAILALQFTSPQETMPRAAQESQAAAVEKPTSTLLAFHQRMNLNLDLP